MMRRLLPWAPARRGLALLLVLALLAAAGWLGERYSWRWYWGASTTATLGEPSRELASRLDGPVTLTAALPQGHPLRRYIDQLASAYRREHDDFKARFIAPQTQPERARDLGLVRTGQAVVEYNGRAESIGSPTESRVSAALERLMRRDDRFVAFLTGQGARDLMDKANHALGSLGEALERKGYRLQPLDLQATGSVPSNASIVIIADPESPLDIRQQAALRKYLRGGGAVLWLGNPGRPDPDPVVPVAMGDAVATDPEAKARLGVDNANFIVLEPPFEHPAAAELQAPIVANRATTVVTESAASWREQELLALPSRVDAKQQAPLAVSLTHGSWGARAVVLGDTDLLTNLYVGNGSNLRFGLQAIDWLAEAESFIGTYVETARDQRLAMSGLRGIVVTGLLLFGLPLLLVSVAGWRWWRLRRG